VTEHSYTKSELLDRLAVLNEALTRRQVPLLLTAAEAETMTAENLAVMITASAERLVTVTRAMGGMP
jgi:hypothetical protein